MTFDRWPQPETLRAAPDYTIGQLQAAMAEGQILTGQAVHCDAALNLHIRLGALSGIIPRGECVAPFLSGAQREIAVLSCVGRGVCCRVTGQRTAPNGDTELLLSRRLAQEEAMDYIEAHAEPGAGHPRTDYAPRAVRRVRGHRLRRRGAAAARVHLDRPHPSPARAVRHGTADLRGRAGD